MPRKVQPPVVKKIRPPPSSAPLLSPKIWMAPDFDPDSLSVARLRTILEFNHITDPYHRKYQQVALFYTKVLPRIKVLLARHKGKISTIDDSDLLLEMDKLRRKRPAGSDLTNAEDAQEDNEGTTTQNQNQNMTRTTTSSNPDRQQPPNKRIKTSK